MGPGNHSERELWMQTVRGFVANQSPNTAKEDAAELTRQAKRAEGYKGVDALMAGLRGPAAGNQRQLAAMSPVPGRQRLSPDQLPPELQGASQQAPAGASGRDDIELRREAREERREAREERREGQEREQFKLENLQDLMHQLQRGGRAFGSLPTPGGLLAPILVLLFFIFAIVPVNGKHTRLSLMWMAVLGQLTVPQPEDNQKADPALAGWPSAAIANEAAQVWNAINPLRNVPVPSIPGAGILGGGANLGGR